MVKSSEYREYSFDFKFDLLVTAASGKWGDIEHKAATPLAVSTHIRSTNALPLTTPDFMIRFSIHLQHPVHAPIYTPKPNTAQRILHDATDRRTRPIHLI